jgi:uncharacterized membrane protein
MEFLLLVVLIAAMIRIWNRLTAIETKLQASEDRLQRVLGDLASARGVPLRDIDPQAAPTILPTAEPVATPPPRTATSVPPTPTDTVSDVTPSPTAAAASQSLEERLGTRWSVLAGGGALAFGAILLVKYSIEQGVFGPGVRVMLGAALAFALVGLGEWFRRTGSTIAQAPIPAAHIPSILTAAGTVAAFATIYAAHALYGFIGSASAFVLLGATGIATMFAAALHGPAMAGLGLAGSFVTPLLVSSTTPAPWPLVIYLAVVACAGYALARMRTWLWLAAAVVAGAAVWGVIMLMDGTGAAGWSLAKMVHAGLQLALAAAFMAIEPHVEMSDDASRTDRIATAALSVLTALVVATLASTRFDETGWLMLAMAAMGILAVTGLRIPPVATAFALAGIIAVAVALLWPGVKGLPDTRFMWPAAGDLLRLPDLQKSYLTFLAAVSVVMMGTGAWRLWIGRALPLPSASVYALGAILTPFAVLIATYLRVTQFDRSISFAVIAALLGGLLYMVADRFDNIPEEQKTPHTRFSLGAFAAGATAAATLAFVFSLDRGYLTVAFAVTALTTSIFAVVDRIPALRGMVAAIGVIVLGRLAWDPRIMGADIGTWPVLNWLLIGYGAPAVAFLGAGHMLRREKEDFASRICDALGLLFGGLLVFFQIRHALNGGDILVERSGHVEQGLFALMCFGGAYVLNRIELSRRNEVFRYATLIAGVLAAVISVGGLMLAENPLWTREPIQGRIVLSSLLLAYLLPGFAAVLLARSARGVRPDWYVRGAAIFALLLIFAYVTLETRHAFQGPVISAWRSTGSAEMWAYSAVWLALGIAFLGYGIMRGSLEARIASAVLVVLAVLKAILFDASGLTGIWRPLSFLVLGAVLIGIGLVYQRLLFSRPAAAGNAPAAVPPA